MKKSKKVFGLIAGLCLSVTSVTSVSASVTDSSSGTMTTPSGYAVSISMATDSGTVLTAVSSCSVSLTHTHYYSGSLYYLNSNGSYKTSTVTKTNSGTSTSLVSSVYASSFTSGSYTGFYFKGNPTCKFTSVKVPESSVSKTLSVDASGTYA